MSHPTGLGQRKFNDTSAGVVECRRAAARVGDPRCRGGELVSTRWGRFKADWRVRVFVPVVILHLVAFAGLYFLTYRLAVREMSESYQLSASIMLDDFSGVFRYLMDTHDLDRIRGRLSRIDKIHHRVAIKILDANGRVAVGNEQEIPPDDLAAARAAIAARSPETTWIRPRGNVYSLGGIRLVKNETACHGCHGPEKPVLGAILMHVELLPGMITAQKRLKTQLGLLVMAWAVLAIGANYLRSIIIGRPLTRIGQSIVAAGRDEPARSIADLDDLASRLHKTVWGQIEAQRRRESEVTSHMARVEQLAALGEIAAGVSHEIKNPLAGVTAALQVLRQEAQATDPGRVVIYGQILGELDRVVKTVDNLLKLGRPQSPKRGPVNLETVARDAVALLAPQLAARNVVLKLATEGEIPVLQLDSGMMMQLMLNLLTNSSQAVREGGHITVRLTPFPLGDGVILGVEDTGCGIPPEKLDRVFEPFFTTKNGGTGLGLAICRQIVEQHQGTITIESEVGKGTRVAALLPVVSDANGEGLDGPRTAG